MAKCSAHVCLQFFKKVISDQLLARDAASLYARKIWKSGTTVEEYVGQHHLDIL
jgi:hypothetical protein